MLALVRNIALLTIALLVASGCASLDPFGSDDDEVASNQAVGGTEGGARQVSSEPTEKANPYLWDAALDTIGFMPIEKASNEEGVIATDWYVPAASPTERFRVNVTFMSRALRAEAFRVEVKRQELRESGSWADQSVTPAVEGNLEDQILFRALQMRQASGVL